MIKYRLACAKGHEFETWFGHSGAYDAQVKKGHVTCPRCGSAKVAKAIMAPAVASRTRDGGEALAPAAAADDTLAHRQALAAMRAMRDELTRRSENVGERFAEEARRIHYNETPGRRIHGEASSEEAQSLAEEGIPFLPIPRLPDDAN